MEKEHYYPEDVVKEGNRYLTQDKKSLVEWEELKEFMVKNRSHYDFKIKVKKYCTYKALLEGILSEEPNKNFFLKNGLNLQIDGSPVYFTKLEAIQEYKKETNQEKEHITIIID